MDTGCLRTRWPPSASHLATSVPTVQSHHLPDEQHPARAAPLVPVPLGAGGLRSHLGAAGLGRRSGAGRVHRAGHSSSCALRHLRGKQAALKTAGQELRGAWCWYGAWGRCLCSRAGALSRSLNLKLQVSRVLFSLKLKKIKITSVCCWQRLFVHAAASVMNNSYEMTGIGFKTITVIIFMDRFT